MALLSLTLWAAGLILLIFSVVTSAGTTYHSIVMLLWAMPAGYAAGAAIVELTMKG